MGGSPLPPLRAFLWILSDLVGFHRPGTNGSDAHLHHRPPALHRRFCHQPDPNLMVHLLLLDGQRGFRLCGLMANAHAFETLLRGLCSPDRLWADLHRPSGVEHVILVVIPTGHSSGFPLDLPRCPPGVLPELLSLLVRQLLLLLVPDDRLRH